LARLRADYLGRAPIHGRSVAAAIRRLRDAANAAAAAWWEPVLPAVPAGRTPNAFRLIIVAPSSRLETAAERENCGSRLNPSSLTRQPIF
jgi:hypothetical protein